MALFVLTSLTLLSFFLLARWLVGSKYGRVLQAIRDAETRVMFSGYSPLGYKLSIWTLSAMILASSPLVGFEEGWSRHMARTQPSGFVSQASTPLL